MHHRLLAVHADVRLSAKVPLIALLGLMHLRVALAAGVFRRTGRVDNRRVYDGAGRDADALRFQVMVSPRPASDRIDRALEQVAKRRIVVSSARGYAQIHSGKAPKHRRFVERLFHARGPKG